MNHASKAIAHEIKIRRVAYFYSAAERRSPGELWPSFAPALRKGRSTSNICVIADVNESNFFDILDAQIPNFQFIFVDLEGTASFLVSRAISAANLVIVPVQASAIDVRQASKAIKIVQDEEKAVRRFDASRRINFRILMTRTPAPGAPVSLSQKELERDLIEAGIPRFRNTLAERQAFKAMFNLRLSLQELVGDRRAGNLSAAYENVEALALELITILSEEPSQNEQLSRP